VPSLELWSEQQADFDQVERRSQLYALAPVKELIKRHWIIPSENTDVLERRVCDFLGIPDANVRPQLGYAARKSGVESTYNPSLVAWIKRAQQIAQTVSVKKYSEKKLSDALPKLRSLMIDANGIREIPRILAETGVRFVVVEHLPRTKVDGATCWLGPDSPVIVMSLRYDRLDNFWHTLLHEIDHVLHGEGKGDACIDDLGEGQSRENSPEELRCEEFAATFSIPRDALDDFVARVRPYFTPEKATGFALRMKVHPAIAAGQIRNRFNNYSILSGLVTAKVRSVIFETAACDGWKREYAVAL
jgi:HTH-type transcriptional regulator/antitoxin HigA